MTIFQQLVEDAGYETRSYSGRGMYGKECLAIVVPDALTAVQNIAHAAGEDGLTLSAPKSDSMGLETVVYWPNQKYTEDK